MFQAMTMNLKMITLDACFVADGGWGTEFQKIGLEPGFPPEKWNLDEPGKVLSVARSYVEAGAQIILTNTFGGNTFRLAAHDLVGELEAINRRGAEISIEAAGDDALVFGSVGPTGKLLMMKEITEEEMFASFSRQASALQAGGVHAIVIETMSDLQEMNIAARAIRESTSLPLVMSMTFDSGKDKTRTMMGVTPEQAAGAMEKAGAWIVGANCGSGPESYVTVCKRLRAATSKPIWVKPNAGMPEMTEAGAVYRQTPEIFASFALQLRDAGASIIGGCCGTSPAHIRSVREALQV
jgi:5-methyltetrahydrofolate--homocysteine methyltransferase